MAGADQANQTRRGTPWVRARRTTAPRRSPNRGRVERVDWHQFDEVDAEVHQVVEFVDRGVERACRGERSGVQFRSPPLDRAAAPLLIGPARRRRDPTAGAFVHPVGLAGTGDRAARPGRRRAGSRTGHRRRSPRWRATRIVGGHVVQRSVDVESHQLGQRCPHREVSHGPLQQGDGSEPNRSSA